MHRFNETASGLSPAYCQQAVTLKFNASSFLRCSLDQVPIEAIWSILVKLKRKTDKKEEKDTSGNSSLPPQSIFRQR